MCGIAGFIDASADAARESLLERMTGILRHRGPDDSGIYVDADAALGHRRLSIIDLSGGHQPMSNEDGSLWIVYNGEIFNHADVRDDLERAGHVYRTRSDTETVLHAYEEYGPECLGRFRGMFAFALWDRRARTLFCARDRLGIKPFYYYWDGRLFAFASEIKALLEHPGISPALEEKVLPEYLVFGYTSGPETLFSGIRKLMPGHRLTLALNGRRAAFEIRRYWDIPPRTAQAHGEHAGEDRFWIRECRERLEETVRMRLMSDVPLGTFLSGGVDSSAITALVKRMSGGRVETFSVGYSEAPFSELAWAGRVARHLGTDHHEIVVGMRDFFDALPRLVWHEDEPIAWPSSVSLYFVSRLASERVKVVLTGEGADELFAGYARYRHYLRSHRWGRRYAALPAAVRGRIHDWIGCSRLLWSTPRRKLQHTFLGRAGSVESLYLDNFYSGFSEPELELLFNSRPSAAYGPFLGYWNPAHTGTLLDRMLYADQKTYLVELLMKQDQMSMACSIESRVPLLDHPFVEFAARVPANLKIRGGEQKYIFKKAVADLLPDQITYRRKMGFPTPIREWLRARGARPLLDLLRSRDGLVAAYVDAAGLDALVARHVSGAEDCTDRIWRLLNLQIWGELFITGRAGRWRDGSLLRAAEEQP